MNKRLTGLIICSLLAAASFSLRSEGAVPAGRYTLIDAATAYDTKTKLTWRRVSSPARLVWAEALPYCNNTWGAPWRMPTYKELFTLVDTSAAADPTFDTATFSFDPANTFSGYWTSTLAGAGQSMTISFTRFGGSSVTPQASVNLYSVRCVK